MTQKPRDKAFKTRLGRAKCVFFQVFTATESQGKVYAVCTEFRIGKIQKFIKESEDEEEVKEAH